MESNYRDNCEDCGNHKHAYLREFERRFGLRWSNSMQGRNFFKRLHDQHKEIKI